MAHARAGKTPRERAFGVHDTSPLHDDLAQINERMLARRLDAAKGRDIPPCRPHTQSVYKRPRNDDQLPRWLKHRTLDNWTQREYVYSPGISAKCHFTLHSKFHWSPPQHGAHRTLRTKTSSSGYSTLRAFELPPSSPFASLPSSPRRSTALLTTRRLSGTEAGW
jgi:hypothetical protein